MVPNDGGDKGCQSLPHSAFAVFAAVVVLCVLLSPISMPRGEWESEMLSRAALLDRDEEDGDGESKRYRRWALLPDSKDCEGDGGIVIVDSCFERGDDCRISLRNHQKNLFLLPETSFPFCGVVEGASVLALMMLLLRNPFAP
jgi:hypothetical protein